MALPERVIEIVEPSLLLEARTGNNRVETSARRRRGEGIERTEERLVGVLRIGVVCSMESPDERTGMTDVVVKLCAVTENFLIDQSPPNTGFDFHEPAADFASTTIFNHRSLNRQKIAESIVQGQYSKELEKRIDVN
ncbi:hypothetical protein EZV62_025859 [Acer yangbiense]|uniref:Serine-threonine/tyrosine-protein kinase catalytic domain-containing protein n=1 Tax=Acer yangbiense TaxID=1000413 RepID=A0A5C7GYZ8_9ROSI|nr:hypothetical protein EZV62_025859 [Acer yangbiense]